MNLEPSGTINSARIPTAIFPEDSHITREKLQSAFEIANIKCGVLFSPLSCLRIFDTKQKINFYIQCVQGLLIFLVFMRLVSII